MSLHLLTTGRSLLFQTYMCCCCILGCMGANLDAAGLQWGIACEQACMCFILYSMAVHADSTHTCRMLNRHVNTLCTCAKCLPENVMST